jgi:uncharacterized protein
MSLIINIENIPEEGVELKEELNRGWLSNVPEFTEENELAYIKGLIKIRGTLTKEGGNLHLRGEVQFTIRTLCSRCGEEMDHLVDSRFDLVLMPDRDEAEVLEKDLTPEDLDHLFYHGLEVDLTPYFQEQIALEIPMQFLCKPDCKGICPGCAADLNYESCKCSKEIGDPRLAVLRQLKIGK